MDFSVSEVTTGDGYGVNELVEKLGKGCGKGDLLAVGAMAQKGRLAPPCEPFAQRVRRPFFRAHGRGHFLPLFFLFVLWLWFAEPVRRLKNAEALASEHPVREHATLGHVFQQVVKFLVFDAPHIRATEAPKMRDERRRNVATRKKDDVKMRPAVFVKLHLDGVRRIDDVALALPLHPVAQGVENAPQAVPRMIERGILPIIAIKGIRSVSMPYHKESE